MVFLALGGGFIWLLSLPIFFGCMLINYVRTKKIFQDKKTYINLIKIIFPVIVIIAISGLIRGILALILLISFLIGTHI
jgi:hypothetical protein